MSRVSEHEHMRARVCACAYTTTPPKLTSVGDHVGAKCWMRASPAEEADDAETAALADEAVVSENAYAA